MEFLHDQRYTAFGRDPWVIYSGPCTPFYKSSVFYELICVGILLLCILLGR